MEDNKVLVIGLDGVSWNILNPLIEQELMPHLEEFKEESNYGDLQSSIPPVTFPAWKCYSTGKDPSELGVYWWLNADIKNKEFIVNSSFSFDGKDIWERLEERGKRSIVMNIPGTYPASEINGIMISGPISPSLKKSVYPENLIPYLKKKGYYNFPEHRWSIEKDKVIKEVIKIHDIQTEVALELMEREDWDFFHFTFFLTDPVLHHFWKHRNKKYKQEWESFWSNLDKNIGKFLEKIPKDSRIIFMSDHGMTELKSQIYLNRFLVDKGYLKLIDRPRFSKMINYLPIHKTANILNKIHLLDFIYRLADKLGFSELIQTGSEIGINEDIIDWNKTKAFCLSDMVGLIYVNDESLDKGKLKEDILSLKNSEGKEVFKEILEARYIYRNFNESSPELIAIPKEGYRISPSLAKNKVFEQSVNWSATHRQKGFWLSNMNIKIKTIRDIVPSIYSFDKEEENDGK